MINRFEIIGHDSPRPDAERILFCDGTDERIFRPETDLELSHWRPNRTPKEYRAGTSTEICFAVRNGASTEISSRRAVSRRPGKTGRQPALAGTNCGDARQDLLLIGGRRPVFGRADC
jgi:hypothetical protein